jgi:hypothetical protein
MRALLVVAGGLVVLAGVQLFVFPLRTEVWFAWTVQPPMTAVFLGAAYWSSASVEWTAASRRNWADARVAVPGVLLFTTLTLVVTLVHLDRFHLTSEHAPVTRAVTWAWIAIYTVVPVLLAVLWWRQARSGGNDPARGSPLPRPVRWCLLIQAAVLTPAGLFLLLVPEGAAAVAWPWPLTPLTARAIGAWLLSLAVVAWHSSREADVRRVIPGAVGAVAFAVLQAVALLRHGSDLVLGAPVVVYGALLASFLFSGAATLRRAARA